MMNSEQKQKNIQPMRFLVFWVLGYLGASLLGDVIWAISADLMDELTRGDDLFNFIAILLIGSIFWVAFYAIQKILIQRLFQIKLTRWIRSSLFGWIVGFLSLYILSEMMSSILNDNNSSELRIVSIIMLSTVLFQWWLLHDKIRSAWIWVAIHLAFIGLSAFLVGDTHIFIVILYSMPEPSQFMDEFIQLKFLAMALGSVTGLTLLWLYRVTFRKPKEKVKINEA